MRSARSAKTNAVRTSCFPSACVRHAQRLIAPGFAQARLGGLHLRLQLRHFLRVGMALDELLPVGQRLPPLERQRVLLPDGDQVLHESARDPVGSHLDRRRRAPDRLGQRVEGPAEIDDATHRGCADRRAPADRRASPGRGARGGRDAGRRARAARAWRCDRSASPGASRSRGRARRAPARSRAPPTPSAPCRSPAGGAGRPRSGRDSRPAPPRRARPPPGRRRPEPGPRSACPARAGARAEWRRACGRRRGRAASPAARVRRRLAQGVKRSRSTLKAKARKASSRREASIFSGVPSRVATIS